MEQVVVETTLLNLLKEPALCLHLPRFALYLLIAIPLEIYADRKCVCPSCAISTVALQVMTGIGGIVTIYVLMVSRFETGDRIAVPVWFYPLMVVLVGIPVAFFVKGIRRLLSLGRVTNAVVRCMIFVVALYFASTVIMTPVKVNRMLVRFDTEQTHNEPIP